MRTYEFTADWSASWLPYWPEFFADCVGKPGLRFVEVGSYEGRSATWLVDNVLTGEDCLLACIDAWTGYDELPGVDMVEVEQRFDRNVAACSRPAVIDKIKMPSNRALPFISSCGAFDFIYIDGSHKAVDVLADAALAWRLLKVGGVLIFDDYDWEPAEPRSCGGPKLAVGAFLAVVGGAAQARRVGAQAVVKRVR